MAKVTGFTAPRMLEIEQASIVDAAIEGEDELIFYTRGGKRIRAGVIRGGTAEWIEEYKPIVDSNIDTVNDLLQQYNDMHDTIGRLDRGLGEHDQIFEDMHEDMAELDRQTLEAIRSANNSTKKVYMEYATAPDHLVPPTTGWSTSQPFPTNNDIVWQRQVNEFGSGHVERYAPAPITGHKGSSPTMVYIVSTNGTVFKQGVLATTLVATVWHNDHKIEDLAGLHEHVGETAYLEWSWSIPSTGERGIYLTTDSKITQGGFVLSINTDDVDVTAVFDCTVNL